MNGPDLFESMYADDTEGKKMKEMPGVDELVTTYPFTAELLHMFIFTIENQTIFVICIIYLLLTIMDLHFH